MSRFILRLTLFFAIPLIAAIVVYQVLATLFAQPVDLKNTTVKLFEIAPGATFSEIADNLEEQKILRNALSIKLISRFGRRDLRIKPGEYELTQSMTPRQILDKLLSGEIFKRIIVLKEGASVFGLPQLVEEAGLVPSEEFTKAIVDRRLLDIANIKSDSFEGYLYPDTYTFSRPIVAKDILWQMLEEGDKHWPPEYTQRADDMKRSRHEILTLASIIEKETTKPEEQATVSSVLHNRLTQGMPLQSELTVRYGMRDSDDPAGPLDIHAPTPYNTFTNYGLPPGPICNPGQNAIRAALYPKETPYLYFMPNGAGGHIFSTTLEEHNNARQKLRETNDALLRPSPTPSPIRTGPNALDGSGY